MSIRHRGQIIGNTNILEGIKIHGSSVNIDANKDVDLSVVEQFTTALPEASEGLLGRIVQYIGDTTTTYTNGYFYKCVSDGEDPATYSWERIDVQPTTTVVDNVTTQSSTDALSANMGYELQEQISQLQGLGRYLSVWDCTTGLPQTNPTVIPYEYKAGDYYIVGNVVKAEPESLTGTQIVGEGLSLTIDPDTSRQNRFYTDLKRLIGEPLTDVDIYAVYTKNTVSQTKSSSASGDTSTAALTRQGSAYVKQLEVKALLESMEISDYESFIGTSIRVHEEGSKGKILVYGVYRSTEGYDTQTPALGVYTRETKDGEDPVEGIKKIIEDEWYIKITGDLVLGPVWSCTVYKLSIGDSGSPINWVYDINIGGTRTGWLDPFIIEGTPEEGDIVRVSYRTEKINYKPNGTEYTGEPSTTIEDREVSIDDSYIYDGLLWHLLSNAQKEITFSSIVGSPYDNTNLANALDAKQDNLTAGTNITITNNVISSTSQESFFRGRFEDWVNVPTDSSLYQANFRGETTPCNSDYMVVDNASGYVNPDFSKDPDNIAIRKSLQDQPYGIDVTIGETTTHYTYTAFPNWTPLTESGWVSIKYSAGSPGRYFIKTNVTYYVDNERHNENTETEVMVTNQSFETVHYISKNPGVAPIPLRGGWNFGYFGTWDEDGKNGWKPQYQVEDVLPIASPTEQGIAKLYNTTGQNTDGSMTQKSITDKLGEKQDTLTPGTNITIEEDSQTGNLVISSTAQESFFRGNFNEWSDVPTDTSLYVEDIHGNRIPQDTDFIVIEDASQFIPSGELMNKLVIECLGLDVRITDETGVSKEYNYTYCPNSFVAIDDYYSLKYEYGAPGNWFIKTNDGSTIIVKGVTYQSGQVQLFNTDERGTILNAGMPPQAGQYQGAWRFAYYGVWATAGLTGWTPQYKIENTLPIISDTQLGVGKVDGTTIVADANGVISATAKESFYRGKFGRWSQVPTDSTQYDPEPGTQDKTTPTTNDFMVIADASDYAGVEVDVFTNEGATILNEYWSVTDFLPVSPGTYAKINYTRTYTSSARAQINLYTENKTLLYSRECQTTTGSGDYTDEFQLPNNCYYVKVQYMTNYDTTEVLTLGGEGMFTGSWRFYYSGVWSTDGKSGWKPQYQIENTLPLADDQTLGIAKLYTTTGQNTDGSMDQNSITTALGTKQDTLTEGSGISIDENNVISATFSESYFRGKFSTWDTVPSDYRSYYPDYTGSTKPTRTDYMVVEDPSSYVKPGMPIQIYNEPMTGGTAFARFVFGATDITLNHNEVSQRGAEGIIIGTNGNQLKITYSSEVWKLTSLDVPVIVDGVTKPINEIALQWHYVNPSQETLYKEINFIGQSGYEGTWRFSYQSDNWDASGKNGWEPEYQIEDVLPIATDTVAGIAKLYTTTGQNTDGSMTQKSITDALDTKQDTLTAGNNITIDANNKIDAADKTLISFVIWEDEE